MLDLSDTCGGARTSLRSARIGETLTTIREFLVFKLGLENYGVDILRVQEIRSYEPPTHMANAPEHVLGVINLRGVIVPVIDMRIRFNLQPVHYDTFTVVIVLNIGSKVVGMVVDGVSDVITLGPEQLHPAPAFSSTLGADHVLAIGSVGDRMLILLDIEAVMTGAESGLVAQTSH